jgi:ribosome maturation factor RimP
MTLPSDLFESVKPAIEEHLEHAGYVLVAARSYRAEGGRLTLELLVDRAEGGISLDEVTTLSREIAGLLDAPGVLESTYVLDVSSPGLDRPLTTPRDFKRVIGRTLRVFLKEPVAGKIEHMGLLADVAEAGVILSTKDTTIDIPFTHVNKAKQVIL